MKWKTMVILISTVLFVHVSVVKAQGFLDPFGLRRSRDRKDSSRTRSSSEEESPGDKRRLPFTFLNPFEWSSLERDRDQGRRREGHSSTERSDEIYEDYKPTTSRPSSRNPNRRNHNNANERNEVVVAQPRSLGPTTANPNSDSSSDERGDDNSSNQYYGPCGPSNIGCSGDYIRELGLEWSQRVHNGTGIYIRDPYAPGGRGFLPVGIDQLDEKFGYCMTPEEERGYCRHLEHCVLEEFRSDFITFLKYQCDIPNKKYVGVCCPDTDLEYERQLQTTTTTTTPRPRLLPIPDPRNFPFLPPPPSFPFFGSGTTTTTTTQAPRRRSRTTRRPRPSARVMTPGLGNCGVNGDGSTQHPVPRIVGGRVADPKDWPWMVALLKKSEAVDYRAGQYCGGVLISEFHVLTAAHCVDGYAKDNLAARVGEYDFSTKQDTNSQDIDFADIFVHEEYNRYTYQNDIAVLKLARSAFFDRRIKIICLPTEADDEKVLVNQVGHVAGFGTIYYGGPASDVLMEIVVPIWSQEECQESYTQPIEETNLCAGVRAGSRDSCQGDSGGPLQLQLRGRWTVVGVVSWGIKCSEPGYPGVYTRVSKYLRWITSRMNR